MQSQRKMNRHFRGLVYSGGSRNCKPLHIIHSVRSCKKRLVPQNAEASQRAQAQALWHPALVSHAGICNHGQTETDSRANALMLCKKVEKENM